MLEALRPAPREGGGCHSIWPGLSARRAPTICPGRVLKWTMVGRRGTSEGPVLSGLTRPGTTNVFSGKFHSAGSMLVLDPTRVVPEGWLPIGIHGFSPKQTLRPDATRQRYRFTARVSVPVGGDPARIESTPDPSFRVVADLTALSRFHPWLLNSWGADLLFTQSGARSGSRHANRHVECRCLIWRLPMAPREGPPPQKKSAIYGHAYVQSIGTASGRGLFGPSCLCRGNKEYERSTGEAVFISTRSWERLYAIHTLLGIAGLSDRLFVTPILRGTDRRRANVREGVR